MVISLTGTVDSVPVLFTRTAADTWETVVPPDLEDGSYIVELNATDDAGNQTYHTAVLWVWQNVVTFFRIIDQPFFHRLLPDGYRCSCTDRCEAAVVEFENFRLKWGDRFCTKIL